MDHTVCTSLGGRNHRCCSSRPLCCIRGRSHRLQTVVVLPQAKCVPQVANLCAAQRMHLTCSMRCPCTRFCACHSVCSTHATQQGTELSYTTTLHSSTHYGSQRRDAVTQLWVVLQATRTCSGGPPRVANSSPRVRGGIPTVSTWMGRRSTCIGKIYILS
jgi:hypothetical protein